MEANEDATSRTGLAAERTMLAWWRTALTAFAVALGVGRLLPELAPDDASWPYALLGLGFAVYGVVALLYGTASHRPSRGLPAPLLLMAAGGLALGVATAVLIGLG